MDDIRTRIPLEEELRVGVRFGQSGEITVTGINAIIALSYAQYASLTPKDTGTLYIVNCTDHIELYLGELPLLDPTAVHGVGIDTIAAASEEPASPDTGTLYVINGGATS